MQRDTAGQYRRHALYLANWFARTELQACPGTDAMFPECNNGWPTAARRVGRRARRDMRRHPGAAYTWPNGQCGLYLVQAALVMTKIQAQWPKLLLCAATLPQPPPLLVLRVLLICVSVRICTHTVDITQSVRRLHELFSPTITFWLHSDFI